MEIEIVLAVIYNVLDYREIYGILYEILHSIAVSI